ncbi:MAG: hypothetical protein R6V03_05855 [Kiritimatiellia bacterium]
MSIFPGKIFAWTAVFVMIAAPALAVDYTWDGGGDGSSWKDQLNWDLDSGYPDGADDTAWINSASVTYSGGGTLAAYVRGSGVNLAFTGGGTYTFNNVNNDFTGTVSVAGGTLEMGDNNDGVFGDAGNDVTLDGTTCNDDWNPASGRTVTIGAGGFTAEDKAGPSVTFNDADQLQGSGLFTFRNTSYGATFNISQPQTNFSGGFSIQAIQRRNTKMYASAVGAMGTGAAAVEDSARIHYVWGAQVPVGGVAEGVTAEVGNRGAGAAVDLDGSGTGITTPDRFIIEGNCAIVGDSTQLGEVTRVDSFSASPAGPEVILTNDSIVAHDTISTNSIANLGTNADLVFGLERTFNDSGFAITIGAGTPWKGFSQTPIYHSSWGDTYVLQLGTVTIAAGTDEIILQASTIKDYSGNRFPLVIGSGSDSPTFTAAGETCPARIIRRVRLDTTAPDFAGGISRFIVNGWAALELNRADCLDGLPVEVEANATLRAYTSGALDGDIELKEGGKLTVNYSKDVPQNRLHIQSGQKLSGEGLVDLTDTNCLVYGTVNPGTNSATGGLDITCEETVFKSGSTLEIEVASESDCDLLRVTGNLTFESGCELAPLPFETYGATSKHTFRVARCASGGMTGVPAIDKWTGVIVTEGGYDYLEITPPPAGTILILE